MRLYNRRFHLLDQTFRYSKTLQFIGSLRKTVITEVSSRRGMDIHQVVYNEELTKYHQKMDDANQGDQLRERGSGFSSKAHFKIVTNLGL